GTPEDIPRYQRVFGPPADDPQFHRLRALAYERFAEMEEAHHSWQQFEKSVADHPAAWPGEAGRRARALVWLHMGHNAASVPDAERERALPPSLRSQPARPRPLKPTAEKCFEHAIGLAPDLLEPYQALFECYQEAKKPAKAQQAARRLLERFPEHA